MRNAKELDVKILCDNDDMRLTSEQAHVEGTAKFLKHASEYAEIKGQSIGAVRAPIQVRAVGDHTTASQFDQAQAVTWHTWLAQRWYVVPLVTPGQSFTFTYVTNVVSDARPGISLPARKPAYG